MTKKSVLLLGTISGALLIFFAYIQSGDVCYSRVWCNKLWESINLFGEILFVFIPVLLFSLITYKMRDEVFQAWWRFARWFVPVIIVVTFLFNTSHQQSGFGGVAQGAFEFFILAILYTIFIVISTIRIILAYKRSK